MRKFLILFLALAGGAAAEDPPASLTFNLVARDVVAGRLKEVKKKNEMRKGDLKRLFEESGCTGTELIEQKVKGSKLPNVVCTLEGTGSGTVIVGAHYDFTGRGSTGVVDNWSGASLLPSLYASLRTQPRKHTFVFVGFTDEERGMVGSRFYTKQLTNEQRAGTRAMVNIDTVGLDTPKVWASHSDAGLLQALHTVAVAMQVPLQGVNFEQVGSTDSEPFRLANVPAITVHSVTQENWPVLHSDKDKSQAVNLEDYYNTYRLLAAYLVYLDRR